MAKLELIQVTEDELREPQWLWYPYIPAGNVTLMFGRGGIGKSYISTDIAARVSSGKDWPLFPEQPTLPPQKVLFLSAEDDIYSVIGPRLVQAGADLKNIYFAKSAFVLGPSALTDLRKLIKEFAVTFVFLDPIVAYMGGVVDMNRMNEVRSIMGGLQQIAQETGIAMVVVHHARKGKDGDTADADYEKASGSADFINAVRSAIFVTKGNSGNPIFSHVKTNYGKRGPTLEYQIGDQGIEWLNRYEDGVLGRPTRQRDQAIVFLKAILASGPVPSAELEALARDEGINKRTLARAKVGIARSFPKRLDGKMVWYMELEDGATGVSSVEGRVTDQGSDRRVYSHGSGDAEEAGEPAGPDRPMGGGGHRPGPDPKAIYEEFMKEARGSDQ